MDIEVKENEIIVAETLNQSHYYYDQVPALETMFIEDAKKTLLQEMDLEDMLMNLDNSSELLFVAFCALNGRDVQADLDGLQARLLALSGKSKQTITTFRDQSKSITIKILGSYKWMRKGMVKQAEVVFNATSQYAAQMAKASHELSLEFENLANETTEVLKKVEVEHAQEIKKRDELKDELQKMNAEKAKQDSMAKSLADDIAQVQIEYQEEKTQLAKAEKQDMIMGITSAITGAISLGLSTFVQTQQVNTGIHQQDNSVEREKLEGDKQNNLQKQDQVKSQQKETQDRLNQYQDEFVNLENVKRTLQEQYQNKNDLLKSEQDETLKNSLQKEIQDIEKQIKDNETQIEFKKTQIKKTESSLKDYTAELSGLAESLKSITDSLKNMQIQAHSAYEEHSKKVMTLLDTKLQLEKQKRESLAEIEKFAILIQQNNQKKITTDTAIQMLLIAIRCLKKVSSSLLTASLFWNSLEQYCQTLSQSMVNELLNSVNSLDKEERIEFFTDSDFVLSIVQYASQWAAMYYVCDEYYYTAKKIYEQTDKNFTTMPSEDEAMKIAQERSTFILSGVQRQKHMSDTMILHIQKQKQEEIAYVE